MSIKTEKKNKRNFRKRINSDNPKFRYFSTMSLCGPKMLYLPKCEQNGTFLVHQRSHFAISDSHQASVTRNEPRKISDV